VTNTTNGKVSTATITPDLGRVQLVGTINMSPDSYVKESIAGDADAAVIRARRHIKEGAAIVEVGGLSGGTGASRVSDEEEYERVVPAVTAIAREFPQVAISVDTFRARVAAGALQAGATWINDVTAGEADGDIIDVVREGGATFVAMHLAGPGGCYGRKLNRPHYRAVVSDVHAYLAGRVAELERRGVTRDRIVVDVGLSAGKRPPDDYRLLHHAADFSRLGCRHMVSCSRKGFIEAVSPVPPEERIGGSVAAGLWAALHGADYLRVHEIRPFAQALDVFNAILAAGSVDNGTTQLVPALTNGERM
jgi:dihydropteroate synthase